MLNLGWMGRAEFSAGSRGLGSKRGVRHPISRAERSCRAPFGGYRGSDARAAPSGVGRIIRPGGFRRPQVTESAEPMIASQAPNRKILSMSLRAGGVAMALLALGGCKIENVRVHNPIHLKPIHIKHHRITRTSMVLPPSDLETIGVNAYLWRAALDTVSVAPLVQSDPTGGVIITDWYVNPSNPGERMKVTVEILDKDLRSDALRVTASRQVAQAGVWVDAPVEAATVQRFEEVILTKARDLRQATLIK